MTEIYMFASTVTEGMFAFSGNPEGLQLPAKHGPWKRTRTIQAEEALPHRIDRTATELAIKTQGCQLWRVKNKPRGDQPAAPSALGDDSTEATDGSSTTARRRSDKS